MASLYDQFGQARYQYQRDANALERVINTLQIPVQGIAGAVNALDTGESPIEGAIDYITNHKDFVNLLQERGIDGKLAMALGFAANVVADPVTYTGVGALTKVGKVARGLDLAEAGAKAAGVAMPLQEAFGRTWAAQAAKGQRALVTFAGKPVAYGTRVLAVTDKWQQYTANSVVGQTVGKIFGNLKSSVPEWMQLRNISRKAAMAKYAAVLGKDLAGESKAFYDGMREAGVHPAAARDILRDVIELAKIPDGALPTEILDKVTQTVGQVAQTYAIEDITHIAPHIQRATQYINAANAAFLTAERRSGLPVSKLIGDLNYLKRVFTPEGMDAYVKATKELSSQSSAYEISARFASQVRRDETLRSLTMTEINDLSQQGKLTILTGGRKVKLFEDEPFFATFVRGSESTKAVEAAEMTKDAVQVYGKEVRGTTDAPIHATIDAPDGYAFLPNRLAEDLGIREYEHGMVVRDVALPKDIVRLLNTHYERILSPAELQPALRGYDALTRMWKNITLPIWPAYHLRNLVSDFLMITHGADDYGLTIPRAVGSITDATKGFVGRLDELKIRGERMSWDDFAAMLDHYGLKDYTPGREIEDVVTRPYGLKNFRKGILGWEERFSNTTPLQAAVRAGQFRQNTINAGYFLGLLRDGVAPDVAALEVKKRLFDFADLTDVEKQTLRRVFPFYSWLRHNIPYQIGAMLHKPAILSKIGWARSAASGGQGPAGDVMLPGFLAQGLPSYFGGDDRKPEFLRLKGLLPQADILALSNPLQETMNALSPVIKTPLEISANYDFFQRQPLERYPGERSKRLGVPVSSRYIAPVMDQVRALSEANNLLRDTPLGGKIAGLLLTKDYKIDADLQRRLVAFKFEEEKIRVKKMMYQAAQRGDSGAIIRLRQYLVNVQKNPSQLLK